MEAITALTAKVPSVLGATDKLPCVPEIVSVIVPLELDHSENPDAGAPAHIRSCEVTDVGAKKQIEFAAAQRPTAALLDP